MLREITSIEKNNPTANFYLGFLHQHGLGIEKSIRSGLFYYRKAAKFGNAKAMTAIGDMYYSGYGVNEDTREALKYYKRAMELNDS